MFFPWSLETNMRKAKLLALLLQKHSTNKNGISQSINAENIIKSLVRLRSTIPLKMNNEFNDDDKTQNDVCNSPTPQVYTL